MRFTYEQEQWLIEQAVKCKGECEVRFWMSDRDPPELVCVCRQHLIAFLDYWLD